MRAGRGAWIWLSPPFPAWYSSRMATCIFCGSGLPNEKVYRTSLCESCGSPVKVCLNCSFYSPGAHWDCHESIPEAVREKDKANFCDYFVLATEAGEGAGKRKSAGDEARSKLDNLFGD